MASAQASKALDLIVRFSNSSPDVSIAVLNSTHISILGLKQRIRSKVEDSTRSNRFRLIYGGRVLAEHASLNKSLGNVATPPRRDDENKRSDKARGKLPVRESQTVARVYIHCSVGDVLTLEELETERRQAVEADAVLLSDDIPTITNAEHSGHESTISTTPPPRGFDGLLSTGFTAAEVASLRTQFLAIQAHTHTPDTMPTGPALLAMEERWLEQPNAPAAGEGGFEELGSDDGLDDMFWGTLIGFFWPMGLMCLFMREEGIWSRRRQLMIMLGFCINLMFGFLRVMG